MDSADASNTVSYVTLVPNAPAATAQTCPGTFNNLGDGGTSLPWPPANYVGTNMAAPTQVCGSQRPGINLAPSVGPDGTIYTASLSHFDGMSAYLVAVNPNLTPKWAASLQSRLSDGCGVLVAIAPQNDTSMPNSCRNRATQGVDPTTNAPGSGVIIDEASSSPTILPDGTVVFGALELQRGTRALVPFRRERELSGSV